MISCVLPYYKRFGVFQHAVHFNKFLFSPEVETVLVLDEPTEEREVVDLVRRLGIKAKVIVNDEDHPWRPPCRSINVGIRHSSGDYVSIFSPESIVMLPCPSYLFDWVNYRREKEEFLTGVTALDCHMRDFERNDAEKFIYDNMFTHFHPNPGYGFILVKKSALVAIKGYDEARTGWGGDDDDLRLRLEKTGLRWNLDLSVRIAHIADPRTPTRGREHWEPYGPSTPEWGRSFSRVAYDWKADTRAAG